jgi:outer membrane protein TolC
LHNNVFAETYFNIRILRYVALSLLLTAGTCQAQLEQVVTDLGKLSFKEFERIALDSDPVISGLKSNANAYRERAIASNRLPDPRIRMALANMPTDSFDFDQEPMTQKIIGIQQMFPPWGSLDNRQEQLYRLGEATDVDVAQRELEVLRGVRHSWLELYYQFEAVRLVQDSARVFDELVKISRFRYRAGRGNQHDVVRAELELSLLQDRITMSQTEQEVILSELGRWIGASHIQRQAPLTFPELPQLPGYEQIRQQLNEHPVIRAAEARVDAGRAGVEVARAQYKPSFMVDVSYGQRDNDRADLVSGMISFNVPIFTSKRQDRNLAASRDDVSAAKDTVESRRRTLREQLETNQRRWQRLNERYLHYERSVMPFAEQFSQSSLSAYQSGVSDFTVQVRARLTELENRLKMLRLKVDRAKAHASLLYLYGDRTL